jgi:acyl-CoA synthetase (AMP-forming)/AMP-acid ligase II
MFKHLISRSRLVVHHHNITSKLLFSSSSTRLATYTDDPILNNTFTFTNKKKSWSTSVTPVNLIDDTVGELIEKSALERPNDVCYIFPHNKGLQIKFIELQERVNHIAQNLLALGFQKGERIAFLLPNTSELIVSMLAAASIGLVSVLLNPGYQLVEIEYMLNKVQCKGVVVYDTFKVLKHLDILKNICPEMEQSEPGELKSSKLPYLKHVIVLNSPLEKEKKIYKGTWSYNQISEKKLSNISYLKPYVDRDDLAFILFTVIFNIIIRIKIILKNFGL